MSTRHGRAPAPAADDRPLVVVDASVCLKWALDDEEAVAQAVALRDDALAGRFRLVAPSLWLYEVINGLVVAARMNRLAGDLGAQALRHILNLRVVHLADPDSDTVYAASLHHGIAAYDSAYLALAETLGVPLWTGDRRFYEAVGPAVPLVRWIGDYPG
jgi:predicted nucleic acid-binding protein